MCIVDSFVKDIKEDKSFSYFENNNYLYTGKIDKSYPHLTFKVSNVSDYIKIIDLLSNSNFGSFVNGEIIYRGMAKDSWTLMPSLGRFGPLDEFQEYNLVNSFLSFRPEAFYNLETNFNILSKMQHYELPTRLLDFTCNPLIALYFACCEKKDETNGRIVCHRAYVNYAKDPLIETICGLYKYPYLEDIYLDDLEISPQEYFRRLYINKDSRLLVARPPYWNERMQRQSAVFMIFPNRLYDHYSVWAHGKIDNYPHHWELHKDSLTLVSEEPLENIYDFSSTAEELEIHTNYVCHDSSNKIYSLYKDNKIFDNWEKPLIKRFQFDSCLEPIDMDSIKNDFCSIIIDKNDKQQILDQLQNLNIDEGYIFPELNYTARKLKGIYLDNN